LPIGLRLDATGDGTGYWSLCRPELKETNQQETKMYIIRTDVLTPQGTEYQYWDAGARKWTKVRPMAYRYKTQAYAMRKIKDMRSRNGSGFKWVHAKVIGAYT
jgi:hypothetical protein